MKLTVIVHLFILKSWKVLVKKCMGNTIVAFDYGCDNFTAVIFIFQLIKNSGHIGHFLFLSKYAIGYLRETHFVYIPSYDPLLNNLLNLLINHLYSLVNVQALI